MRKILLASLALAVAAAPAVAHRGADDPVRERPKQDRPHTAKSKAKGPHHLLRACVTADASADGVQVKVLGGNRHMRRALAGATEFTAKLDADTRIRLVGRARHLPKGSVPRRAPRIGTYADLTAGDRVIIRFRAPRGTAAADLPAALRVIDRGPGKRCATVTPPVEEAPGGEKPDDGSAL